MKKFTHSLALLSLVILASCSSGPDSVNTSQDLPRHQAVGGPVPPPGLTQVVHDTSLSGTGTNLSPLGINTTNTQKRVTGTCSDPDAILSINSDGTVVCSTTTLGGTLTSGDLVSASGAHSTTNYAGTTCASDKAAVALLATGAATCSYFVDSGTNGVSVTNNVASIDPTYTQRRVTGTCTDPDAIVSVNSDGTVNCSTTTLGGTLASGALVRATGAHSTASAAAQDDGATTTIPKSIAPICVVNNLPSGSASSISGDFLNDWDPTGVFIGTATSCSLDNATTFMWWTQDNQGTRLTGIKASAHSSTIKLGSEITLCNAGGNPDGSETVARNLDNASLPVNRILTPQGRARICSVSSVACRTNADCVGGGGDSCPMTNSDYKISPGTCSKLRYTDPGHTTLQGGLLPGWPSWVMDANSHFDTITLRNLGIFPHGHVTLTTGCYDNFTGTDDLTGAGGSSYSCTDPSGRCGIAGTPSNLQNATYIQVATGSSPTDVVQIASITYTNDGGANSLGPIKIFQNIGPGILQLGGACSPSHISDGRYAIATDYHGVHPIVMYGGSTPTWLWHDSQTGGWAVFGKRDYRFDEQQVWATQGVYLNGTGPTGFGPNAELTIDNTVGGATANIGVYMRDVGTYTGSPSPYGMLISTSGTTNGNNTALDLIAQNGTTNFALKTEAGGVFFGSGYTLPFFYVSGTIDVTNGGINTQGSLVVGSSAFGGTTVFSVDHSTGKVTVKNSSGTTVGIISPDLPSVDHGSLSANASNWRGRVTSIGSNTSVTLTFGGSPGYSNGVCTAQVEGSALGIYVTPSDTAPVFNCYDTTTGAAVNCNNFSYRCE